MGRPLWQLLVLGTQRGKAVELTCDECIRVMDYYVDGILESGDSQRLQESVIRHLSHCPDCRQEIGRKLDDWERLMVDQDGEEQ